MPRVTAAAGLGQAMAEPGDHLRVGVDWAVAAAVGATFLQWLPPLSAILGLIWFAIQIWESRTVRHAIANWRQKRQAMRLRKLRAQQKIIVARLAAADMVRAAKAQAVEKVEHAKAVAKAEETMGSPDLGDA